MISNVKHWVGDGGTIDGVDRGINPYSEDHLRNIHAMGYFSGLNAGAQVVMSSFNSWAQSANYDHDDSVGALYNNKIHGSKYLLTDVLKEQMKFDGLVVTDWHGHSEISKCTDGNATYAINAGNDILMVPVREHWQAVYKQTVADVRAGKIALTRIDDAVARILRVKMRANLWNKPAPSERSLAGNQAILGAAEHREVAREAVQKSMVLLKNKDQILPISKTQKVILTGSAANDLQKQSGGWNLTWQGDENSLDDFPGATTLKMALEAELGQDNVCFDPNLEAQYGEGDIAIVAFGEDPYAEMMGDIKEWQTLEFASLKRSYATDSEKIRRLHEQGVKVISVFFSGRPLFVNEEISLSAAFVAAFLPGSEGRGMTDVLIANKDGHPNVDFVGKLSYSWPNKKRSDAVSRIPLHIPNYQVPAHEQSPEGEHAPLFEYGYGLNYSDTKQQHNLDDLDLDRIEGDVDVQKIEHLYGIQATIGDYQLRIADASTSDGVDVSRNNLVELSGVKTKPFNYQQQQDAVDVEFRDRSAQVYVESGIGQPEDFTWSKDGKIVFELKVIKASSQPLFVTLFRKDQSLSEKVDVREQCLYDARRNNQGFVQIEVNCRDLVHEQAQLRRLDKLFVLTTDGDWHLVLANVRWESNSRL